MVRPTGRGSTYRMRKCRAMDRQMAPTSQGLDQGGIFSRDWFSDRLQQTGRAGGMLWPCAVH